MTKASDLQKQIQEGVSNLLATDKWKAHLKFASSFHNYSFGNTLLIYFQNKNASHVAGFQTWKKLGRYVKKGEKGISIVVPCFNSKAKKDEAEVEQNKAPIYFIVKTIFDISQTEGAEVADVNSIYHLLDTQTPEGLFGRLQGYSESVGLPVSFEAMEDLKGGYTDGKGIYLNEKLPQAHRVKSLIHELAHNQLGHLKERSSLGRDDKELEAESTAFIVANCLGLDSSEVSFAYLANWSGGKDADKKLLAVGQSAMKAAKGILVGLGKEQVLEEAA